MNCGGPRSGSELGKLCGLKWTGTDANRLVKHTPGWSSGSEFKVAIRIYSGCAELKRMLKIRSTNESLNA